MKQPPPRHQVPVVAHVEAGGTRGVQLNQSVVAARGRACPLPERGEARVDVGVVVDVGAEVGAPGCAYGVRAAERGEVAYAETLGGEPGDEVGEAIRDRGEAGVGGSDAGGPRVPAAQRHRP